MDKKEPWCKTYILDTSLLEDSSLFALGMQKVSSFRYSKVEKMKFEDGKRLSLGCGLLLRYALINQGQDPDLPIALTKYGKPYIQSGSNLQFNLSHSGNRAVCSISNCPVGCDIEMLKSPSLNIAKRFFSSMENKILAGTADPDEKEKLFFKIWTMKESFVKCTGKGLSEDFASFSVNPTANTPVLTQMPNSKTYMFDSKYLEDFYAVSLCVETSESCDFSILNVENPIM